MKNFRITVNGTSYDVQVEELGQSFAPVETAAMATPAPKAPKKQASKSASVSGTKVTAPMPGKIMAIKAEEGVAVKKGDVVVTLEAMKMENEILAPIDGKVAVVAVNKGASVETGDLLFSIE